MLIGNKTFDIGKHTYIMGILNVTPDSFSDGGSYMTADRQLRRVEEMILEGADMIDVGGESTRPGFTQVSADEEIRRVIPVIREIKRHFDIPVSVDTSKSEVAKAALAEGCDLINDVSALSKSPDMGRVIADSGAACCLMHNADRRDHPDFLNVCLKDLKDIAGLAMNCGIDRDRIILDPGIGFGKTLTDNLSILKHLDMFNDLGLPLLLGTSRKSVIGRTLDLPEDQRVEGTIATTVMAVLAGWSFVRVHDIKENKRAILMTETVLAVK